MTIEKEFENRKLLHLFNTVQLYLTLKYYNKAKKESIVPPQILCTAIAEQVVNDLESIVCAGKLASAYETANIYLMENNVDIDEFQFNTKINLT